MTVPVENFLAAFPASYRAGNVTVGPMTIGQAILLGAFDVPLATDVEIPADKVLIAAMLLTEAWRAADRPPEAADFKRFARRAKADGKSLAEAVHSARAAAFTTYVTPPKPRAGARQRISPHGYGWPLEIAEFLCGEYGWSWRAALATPVVTANALVAASRQRHGDEAGGFDYVERIAQDEVRARKRAAARRGGEAVSDGGQG